MMKTLLILLLLATQETHSRGLRRHHGGGMMMGGGDEEGMMQGGGGMMGGGGGMMMHGHGMGQEMMRGCDMNTMGKEESVSTNNAQCPMATIHKLVENRNDIERHTKDAPEGVATKTFSKSNTPETNTWIRQHVETMIKLVESGHRVRDCDGLFKSLLDHAADLNLECIDDDETGGVQCKFKGDTDCAVGLAQAHAKVVSAFIAKGWDEVHKDHGDMVPDSCFETES